MTKAEVVESELDELFPDMSRFSKEQADALGIVRGMLWGVDDADYAIVERNFRNRSA